MHTWEARCFVLNGEVVNALFTRFARVDCNGYVRDYEKSSSSKAQEDSVLSSESLPNVSNF